MKTVVTIFLIIVGVFVIWFFFEGFRLMEHNCSDCIFAKKGKCLHDGHATMAEGECWDFVKKKRKKQIY